MAHMKAIQEHRSGIEGFSFVSLATGASSNATKDNLAVGVHSPVLWMTVYINLFLKPRSVR